MSTTDSNKTIEFSFGWFALKLLGQNLYSNAWAAISELVANGFDAGANNVYVYIDASDKIRSKIEIFDDGTGMDQRGLQDYVIVGRNRRESVVKVAESNEVMGRKGIGKLAALYLSENYYLITKTENSQESIWRMKYDEARPKEEKPYLEKVLEYPDITCKKEWNAVKTGTLLQMNDSDLTGLGESAFESLRHKLANYFSLDSLGTKRIHLCVIVKDTDKKSFEVLSKKIAFKNMAYIDYNSNDSENVVMPIKELEGRLVRLPYPKLKDMIYKHGLNVEEFGGIGTIYYDNVEGKNAESYKGFYEYKGIKYPYELKGWIGIHSSIDTKIAQGNDEVFTRNKFYNPIQIRLYVRNKLAVENYLNVLNMNQAFVSFVEGEIRFDILDHTNLPDIATTNRQGLDENDPRVIILSSILKKIIGDLVRKRNELATEVKKEQDRYLNAKESSAKKVFVRELNREMSRIGSSDDPRIVEATRTIANNIKGDVTPKDNYTIFISYCSYDKCISDFFYEILRGVGVKKEEIFYTVRKDYDDTRPLAKQILDSIVDKCTLLFYLTSSDYKRSEYCLFEGGAGWATRGPGEYIILSLTYEEIPAYLSNGKAEHTLLNGNELKLDRSCYFSVITILNRMIDHINLGREIRMESEVKRFDDQEIPPDIELSKAGKTIEDVMDPLIKEYWAFYVTSNEKKYLEERAERNRKSQPKGP